MKPVTPTDAIGLAFTRTRSVLAQPFRLGFFLKIALVAALTQPSFFSVVFSYPLQGVQFAAAGAMHPRHYGEHFLGPGAGLAAAGFAVIAVAFLVGLVVWVGVFYLFCRLRFTLFDLTVYRQGRVGQSWRKYGRQTWRYFGLSLLVMLVFAILIAALAGPLFVHMFAVIKAMGPHNPNPVAMLGTMFPLIGVFLVLGLLWVIVDAVIQDFLLPPMALEDASIEGAFSRVARLFRAEPGQFLLYMLLRFVISVGICWVLLMAVLLVLLLLLLGAVGIGFLLYHSLWPAGLAARAIFVAIAAAMGLVLAALYLIAMIAVYGITAVYKQCYAVYFYGSHYPELGDLLDPPEEDFVGVRVVPPLPPLPPLQEPPPVW